MINVNTNTFIEKITNDAEETGALLVGMKHNNFGEVSVVPTFTYNDETTIVIPEKTILQRFTKDKIKNKTIMDYMTRVKTTCSYYDIITQRDFPTCVEIIHLDHTTIETEYDYSANMFTITITSPSHYGFGSPYKYQIGCRYDHDSNLLTVYNIHNCSGRFLMYQSPALDLKLLDE